MITSLFSYSPRKYNINPTEREQLRAYAHFIIRKWAETAPSEANAFARSYKTMEDRLAVLQQFFDPPEKDDPK